MKLLEVNEEVYSLKRADPVLIDVEKGESDEIADKLR